MYLNNTHHRQFNKESIQSTKIASIVTNMPSFVISANFLLLASAAVGGVHAWSSISSSSPINYTPHALQSRNVRTRTTPSLINTRLYQSSPNKDIDQIQQMGLNELQTLLRDAVKEEDYLQAKVYRDVLADRVDSGAYKPNTTNNGSTTDTTTDDRKQKMKRLSWRGLGTAPWLEDRLDALNYKFPTTIQINAFESVNTMLQQNTINNDNNSDGIIMDEITLEERLQTTIASKNNNKEEQLNMGVVISGSTGSGKTLAYLVPLLSTLSESLFTRQRIRVKSEEDIGDVADDLLARVAVQTSPSVRGHGREQVGGGDGKTNALGAALSSMGKSGTDVKNPLALIVVPTRELGVQTALLLYELVGGSTKKTATEFPGLSNMFKYKGPKGVKIGCILDDEEAKHGLKLQTDVAITTPTHLEKLIRDGDILPSKLRVVIYDEADLTLEQSTDLDLQALFKNKENERESSRLTYLVGASVTESLGKLCVRDSVLPLGSSFIATATRFAPLTVGDITEEEAVETDNDKVDDDDDDDDNLDTTTEDATFKDLGLCLDPGLRHERVIAPSDSGLVCLTRMLRNEIKTYEDDLAMGKNETMKLQRPRVVVFFPNEEEAKKAIEPLRDAVWGEHKLCVLLPNTGVNPLMIMEQFKTGMTSVMLATPNSVRGLDFADLTHVYTLYMPVEDPREYLHLAGRVGRIGQMGSVAGSGGRVTSILKPEVADQMVILADSLGFDFVDVEYSEAKVDDSSSVDDMRRYLEDTITLLDLVDDPEVDLENPKGDLTLDYDDDDDDDDDNDE